MKEAIDSYGGIKGCRASVIELGTRTGMKYLSTGWAQTKSKWKNRFFVKVKNCRLLEQFMIDEETGRKVTRAKAAARMRTVRTEDEARMFGKDE